MCFNGWQNKQASKQRAVFFFAGDKHPHMLTACAFFKFPLSLLFTHFSIIYHHLSLLRATAGVALILSS